MQLILKNADVFKKSIEAVSVLIDEAEIIVNDSGLELKATDPSQISMVDFTFPKKAFEKFETEETRLGLDLDYLNQVLSRASLGDKLVLSIDEKKAFLIVTFQGTGERNFQVPLIDISSNDVPNPKIDFDAELKISSSLLKEAFKDAALISTHITIGVDDKKFFVKANSSKGNLSEETPENKDTLSEMKVKKECQSMFPLDYLQDMIKVADSKEPVEISIKSNAPIKIAYNIGDARITYFLAPRIETA
jgi:proliferating cell nuclear antigen